MKYKMDSSSRVHDQTKLRIQLQMLYEQKIIKNKECKLYILSFQASVVNIRLQKRSIFL